MKRLGISTYGTRPARVEKALLSVAEQFAVQRDELLEGTKRKNVAQARAALCKELRAMGFTLDRIGLYLNVHHTTVHAAVYGRKGSREPWQGPIPCPDLSGEWAI